MMVLYYLDITGRLVKRIYKGYKDAGNYTDRIDNIGNGVYLLRMTLDDKVISSKVVNIR